MLPDRVSNFLFKLHKCHTLQFDYFFRSSVIYSGNLFSFSFNLRRVIHITVSVF